MPNVFDITDIEEHIKTLIRQWGISSNVYNNRPKAIDANNNMQDFVVAKVSGAIDDRATHGVTTLSIHLFAKDIKSEKNSKKLSMMYCKLIENLPGAAGRMLFSGQPRVVADVGDNYGYHARIINIHTIIKLKD